MKQNAEKMPHKETLEAAYAAEVNGNDNNKNRLMNVSG